MDPAAIIRDFITILVTIDPIGSIPVFLFAVQGVPKELHRRFAVRAVLIAAVVLIGFLVAGQFLLETLGLRIGSFQIAGGIILFMFAMTMVFGETKASQEIAEASQDPLSGAVFPLAMPSIASPGAMLAIVVLTDNKTESMIDQAITAGLVLLVLLVTLSFLLAAGFIYRFIGNTGSSIVSRVMGIILATIAVDAVIGGLVELGILSVGAL